MSKNERITEIELSENTEDTPAVDDEVTAASESSSGVDATAAAAVDDADTTAGDGDDDNFIFVLDDQSNPEVTTEEEMLERYAHSRKTARSKIEERPRYQHDKDMPFKEKVANFVYHYKAILIITPIILAFLAFLIITSIPNDSDYYVTMLTSNKSVQHADSAGIYKVLEPYAEDLDGDGEVEVAVLSYDCFDSNYNSATVAFLYLDQELFEKHRSYVFILDRGHYDYLIEEFTEEVFTSYEGLPYWIPLKDSDLLRECAYNDGDTETDDLGLVLLCYPPNLNGTEEENQAAIERYEQSVEFFGTILDAYPELTEGLTE